jgi:hypothetical protein
VFSPSSVLSMAMHVVSRSPLITPEDMETTVAPSADAVFAPMDRQPGDAAIVGLHALDGPVREVDLVVPVGCGPT